MTTGPVRDTPRHEFPPLILVPLVVIVGNVLILAVMTAVLGLVGFVLACFVLVWLDRLADAYVKARSTFEDD